MQLVSNTSLKRSKGVCERQRGSRQQRWLYISFSLLCLCGEGAQAGRLLVRGESDGLDNSTEEQARHPDQHESSQESWKSTHVRTALPVLIAVIGVLSVFLVYCIVSRGRAARRHPPSVSTSDQQASPPQDISARSCPDIPPALQDSIMPHPIQEPQWHVHEPADPVQRLLVCEPVMMETSRVSTSLCASRLHASPDIVGQGMFACVERGHFRDRAGNLHDVAVKIASPSDDKKTHELFEMEIECFKKLPPHPNVVKCYGGRLGGATGVGDEIEVFIVEELMDMNLRDIMQGNHRAWDTWTYRHVLHIFREIAVGLEHLDAHKILHHDLKPENVLVKRTESFMDRDFPIRIKIADFGCSSIKQGSYTTMKHSGTMRYMAPEIVMPSANPPLVSGKIDVFSMGVVMWEILTRTNLIPSRSPANPVPSSSSHDLSDCRQNWPIAQHHPSALMELIWSCLEFESSKRPKARTAREAVENMMESDWRDKEVMQDGSTDPST